MTAMILFQSQPQFASLGKSEDVQDEQIKSLHAFQQQNPDAWHGALEAITQSTINHIRHIKDILWRARQHLQCRKQVRLGCGLRKCGRSGRKARAQAGAKYIAAPGCSVPNSSTPEELARFPRALGV